ncbi:MAG TPA: SDR family NAD(P)-dependent oxidoreductase [Candidatus Solibacter sp.]|nr:SDR family NAD(P)-dependent oxidoreductase [Candidatus Solibacter sp.]
MLLRGRVAIVTGAATGIGEAVARLFAEHGASLWLMDRDAAGCAAVARSLPDATAMAGDVCSAADFARIVDSAFAKSGRIDVLINNAGIYPRQTFLEMTEAQWDEMHDTNLKSMFHSMKAVLPHMVKQRSGKIVNISSVTFHLGMATLTHYVASKGGVIGLTRSLAREMGPHNIHINCITPGAIKTVAEAKVVSEDQARQFMASQSLQRRIVPIDVARVCLFLSSELSDGMTGQTLNVDGGWVMY